MSRLASIYICQSCGAQTRQFFGRCSSCGDWNSIIEQSSVSISSRRKGRGTNSLEHPSPKLSEPIAFHEEKIVDRLKSGYCEFDRVLGGGLVPGAITIFDEDNPVSSSSSITQLNFVGAAVTANVSVQSPSGHPGIAATITVIPVSVGDNPPNIPNPNNGELWWESDTGDLYVYYNDGDSAQWVMANAGGRGLTGDKGQKGQQGIQGLSGNAGNKGDKGQKGQTGDVEAQGNKGQKGEIGVGQKGQNGEAGADGTDGDKGETGSATKGEKGEKVKEEKRVKKVKKDQMVVERLLL